MAAVTPEARIARLKEWLESNSVPQSSADLKPGSNLLLTAAIHGLARHSKGYGLTDIEKMGVRAFEAAAEGEEELKTYGQICAEAKSAARNRSFGAINAPSSIMELADDAPLTREQFDEEVKRLGRETVLQPHIRSVKLDQVMPDGTIPETDEFAAASRTLGRGLTMFVDPGEGVSGTQGVKSGTNSSPLIVTLEPSIFKCYRESKEWGRDEIYFTWGFGGDDGEKFSHRTPEFGAVKQNDVRPFPPPRALYSGVIQKCIAGTMICWEADHSSSEWYDKLRLAMSEMAQMARDLSIDVGEDVLNQLIGLLPGFSEYSDVVFWIENIATLIHALLDWLRNKDDKVKENNYGFSAEWLRPWRDIPEGYVRFNFDGGSGGEYAVSVRPIILGPIDDDWLKKP